VTPKTQTKTRKARAAKSGSSSAQPWSAYSAGSEISHFAKFCREHLTHWVDAWEGKPVELEPFQRRMMGEALAYDQDGWPVWRSVVLIMPRKNGKTTLLAAYAIYRLLTSEGSPQILLTASSDKQAGRLYEACANFIRRSPVLSELVRVRDYIGEIKREDGQGVIYRMSSDPARLHGYNPSLVVCDELASWTTPSLQRAYAALTSGGGARQAPQVFTITTAGEAHERASSILGRLLDGALEHGAVQRKRGLQIARHHDAQTLLYNHEAPTVDPHDVRAMKAANPASWISEDFLRRQAHNDELTDAQVLQLHGCVWATAERTWIAPHAWKDRGCERELEVGETVILGFDGSERRDSTVLSAATLDGFVYVLRAWERPTGAGSDWRIPRREVHAAIAQAFERFDVLELAVDPPGWYSEIDQWMELYGEKVVEFDTKQSTRMAPACERFRAGTLNHHLSHAHQPTLAVHVGNCVAKETPSGVLVTKEHPDSPKKIDAAVASVIAYDRAIWHAQNEEGDEVVAFVIDPRMTRA
jgi:phage terminase large subunit-like protein